MEQENSSSRIKNSDPNRTGYSNSTHLLPYGSNSHPFCTYFKYSYSQENPLNLVRPESVQINNLAELTVSDKETISLSRESSRIQYNENFTYVEAPSKSKSYLESQRDFVPCSQFLYSNDKVPLKKWRLAKETNQKNICRDIKLSKSISYSTKKVEHTKLVKNLKTSTKLRFCTNYRRLSYPNGSRDFSKPLKFLEDAIPQRPILKNSPKLFLSTSRGRSCRSLSISSRNVSTCLYCNNRTTIVPHLHERNFQALSFLNEEKNPIRSFIPSINYSSNVRCEKYSGASISAQPKVISKEVLFEMKSNFKEFPYFNSKSQTDSIPPVFLNSSSEESYIGTSNYLTSQASVFSSPHEPEFRFLKNSVSREKESFSKKNVVSRSHSIWDENDNFHSSLQTPGDPHVKTAEKPCSYGRYLSSSLARDARDLDSVSYPLVDCFSSAQNSRSTSSPLSKVPVHNDSLHKCEANIPQKILSIDDNPSLASLINHSETPEFIDNTNRGKSNGKNYSNPFMQTVYFSEATSLKSCHASRVSVSRDFNSRAGLSLDENTERYSGKAEEISLSNHYKEKNANSKRCVDGCKSLATSRDSEICQTSSVFEGISDSKSHKTSDIDKTPEKKIMSLSERLLSIPLSDSPPPQAPSTSWLEELTQEFDNNSEKSILKQRNLNILSNKNSQSSLINGKFSNILEVLKFDSKKGILEEKYKFNTFLNGPSLSKVSKDTFSQGKKDRFETVGSKDFLQFPFETLFSSKVSDQTPVRCLNTSPITFEPNSENAEKSALSFSSDIKAEFKSDLNQIDPVEKDSFSLSDSIEVRSSKYLNSGSATSEINLEESCVPTRNLIGIRQGCYFKDHVNTNILSHENPVVSMPSSMARDHENKHGIWVKTPAKKSKRHINVSFLIEMPPNRPKSTPASFRDSEVLNEFKVAHSSSRNTMRNEDLANTPEKTTKVSSSDNIYIGDNSVYSNNSILLSQDSPDRPSDDLQNLSLIQSDFLFKDHNNRGKNRSCDGSSLSRELEHSSIDKILKVAGNSNNPSSDLNGEHTSYTELPLLPRSAPRIRRPPHSYRKDAGVNGRALFASHVAPFLFSNEIVNGDDRQDAYLLNTSKSDTEKLYKAYSCGVIVNDSQHFSEKGTEKSLSSFDSSYLHNDSSNLKACLFSHEDNLITKDSKDLFSQIPSCNSTSTFQVFGSDTIQGKMDVPSSRFSNLLSHGIITDHGLQRDGKKLYAEEISSQVIDKNKYDSVEAVTNSEMLPNILQRIMRNHKIPENLKDQELSDFLSTNVPNWITEFENDGFLESTSIPSIHNEKDLIDKLIAHQNELLVIKFWKRGCLPCLALSEIYKKCEQLCIAEKKPIVWYSVDIHSPLALELVRNQIIQGTPVVQTFKNMKQVGDEIQLTNTQELTKELEKRILL